MCIQLTVLLLASCLSAFDLQLYTHSLNVCDEGSRGGREQSERFKTGTVFRIAAATAVSLTGGYGKVISLLSRRRSREQRIETRCGHEFATAACVFNPQAAPQHRRLRFILRLYLWRRVLRRGLRNSSSRWKTTTVLSSSFSSDLVERSFLFVC